MICAFPYPALKESVEKLFSFFFELLGKELRMSHPGEHRRIRVEPIRAPKTVPVPKREPEKPVAPKRREREKVPA